MNAMTPAACKLDVVCQQCGHQLKTLAGVQSDDVAVGQTRLRQVAQLRCNAVGRPITVTVRVTLLETAEFAPRLD